MSRSVEYHVDLQLWAWPEEGRWTGYVMHHFDNGTFVDAEQVLAFIDRWARLAHAGQLPWSDGEHPGDVIGLISSRDDRLPSGRLRPLAVYTPRLVGDFFGAEARPADEVLAALRRFERDPAGFAPDVTALWSAFDGSANKIHHYSGWPQFRTMELLETEIE